MRGPCTTLINVNRRYGYSKSDHSNNKKEHGGKYTFPVKRRQGRTTYHNSELSVNPDIWDSKTDHIKTRAIYSGDKDAFNNSVDDRKRLIISIYKANKDKVITSEILERLIDERLHPDKYKEPSDCFFGLFDLFIEKRSVDLSSLRIRDYNVLKRALTRYERFIREIYDKKFVLDIE